MCAAAAASAGAAIQKAVEPAVSSAPAAPSLPSVSLPSVSLPSFGASTSQDNTEVNNCHLLTAQCTSHFLIEGGTFRDLLLANLQRCPPSLIDGQGCTMRPCCSTHKFCHVPEGSLEIGCVMRLVGVTVACSVAGIGCVGSRGGGSGYCIFDCGGHHSKGANQEGVESLKAEADAPNAMIIVERMQLYSCSGYIQAPAAPGSERAI